MSPTVQDIASKRLALVSIHTCPCAMPGSEDVGGMNVYIRSVAASLAAMGVAVDILTRNGRADSQPVVMPLSNGVRLIRLPGVPFSADKDAMLPCVPEFAAQAVDFARRTGALYDGIISQYWLSGLVGNHLKEAWGVPHVAGFHTLELAKWRAAPNIPPKPQRLNGERCVVGAADHLLATTLHESHILTRGYNAEPWRISLAPPGVDSGLFQHRERTYCRQLLGLPTDQPLVLFVGRLIPLKGIDVLLKALARMPVQRRASAVIVGGAIGSPHHIQLTKLAAELGIGDRVQFTGPVAHERLSFYYNAADVCAVPSRYESFGMVALEAMACGCPVVASRVGGLESLAGDDTGLLMEPGSVENCFQALDRLLGDSGLRDSAGRAGLRRSRQFTWESTASSILSSIDPLTDRGAA